jgi:hypothetical protein
MQYTNLRDRMIKLFDTVMDTELGTKKPQFFT